MRRPPASATGPSRITTFFLCVSLGWIVFLVQHFREPTAQERVPGSDEQAGYQQVRPWSRRERSPKLEKVDRGGGRALPLHTTASWTILGSPDWPPGSVLINTFVGTVYSRSPTVQSFSPLSEEKTAAHSHSLGPSREPPFMRETPLCSLRSLVPWPAQRRQGGGPPGATAPGAAPVNEEKAADRGDAGGRGASRAAANRQHQGSVSHPTIDSVEGRMTRVTSDE
jgi:hypothetical protein